MSEPSNEDFSLPLVKVHSETDMDDSTPQLFELFKEDFPLLPKVCSATQMGVVQRQLSSQRKISPFFKAITKPSAHSLKSQSLKEPSLSTRDEKEDCGVSLSEKAVIVVPKVATERKEKSGEGNEKMY
ncbi:hypothetical protein ACSQ67_019218 [Phaseolus vulgaris]